MNLGAKTGGGDSANGAETQATGKKKGNRTERQGQQQGAEGGGQRNKQKDL